MTKTRLDHLLVIKGLVSSRSQAESWIGLGKVTVDGKVARKSGLFVRENSDIQLQADEKYVSRAGLKLASVADLLGVKFANRVVLDVGSSTGGFTDYSLQHGATKVIAVDVGTDQLHSSLIGNPQIELHEKTDIRDFETDENVDIVVIDVSFISLREILPSIARIAPNAQILAMVKPQFEVGVDGLSKGGIVKDIALYVDVETRVKAKCLELGLEVKDYFSSPIQGKDGNNEFFILAKKD